MKDIFNHVPCTSHYPRKGSGNKPKVATPILPGKSRFIKGNVGVRTLQLVSWFSLISFLMLAFKQLYDIWNIYFPFSASNVPFWLLFLENTCCTFIHIIPHNVDYSGNLLVGGGGSLKFKGLCWHDIYLIEWGLNCWGSSKAAILATA